MSAELKIMTFNLRVDVAGDGVHRFLNRRETVLASIEKHSPDVIGFQEATNPMRLYLREELAKRGYVTVGCGRDANMRGESVIVAYKHENMELFSLENRWLSDTPLVAGSRFDGDQSGFPRIYTALVLKHKDADASFLFINTHLDHEGENARVRGAAVIKKRIAEIGLPFILTGDMNALPDSAAIRSFTADALCDAPVTDATRLCGGTFHDFGRLKTPIKIDYIFTDLPCDAERTYVVDEYDRDGFFLSDHLPICAFVTIP